MPSVLQSWVMNLPLRAQGTLLTGYRNCDVVPKNPATIDERHGCSTGEDTPARQLVAFLRYCTLVPADPREVDVPGAWFQRQPPANWKPSQFGHLPLHWYTHLMHCFEVVGYCHPIESLSHQAVTIYARLAHALHLNLETRDQWFQRITEDRVAKGDVVS